MALTTGELQRIRIELGYSALSLAAEPFVGVTALFENVVYRYLLGGATTTSSTSVDAATTATPVAITLASATGFATGDVVWVDVDDRMESATIQNLSGAIATVQLRNAHSGTYPVSQDCGEADARAKLREIKALKAERAGSIGTGELKKVDEIEFYQTRSASTAFSTFQADLMILRDELAAALGVPNAWRLKGRAGSTVAMY
jgi:hypothetical protein